VTDKVRSFQEGATMQVALVVRDLEAEMRRHWEVFKVGPWDIFEVDNSIINPWIYRGKPAQLTCRVAFAWSGDTQVEIIQPVSGYSIYDEHLERRGDGLHHIKLYFSDCKAAVERFARAGYPVIQSGVFDEDLHFYLDTLKDFGYIIELGNVGKVRPSQRRYPA